jgi:hypothetical protein
MVKTFLSMREDFLHYLWRHRRFDLRDLRTTDDRPLEILHPGEPNSHAGPDFFNARIRIGDTLWAGNIELHVRASDWRVHAHSNDPAYDNVILHVVYEPDTDIPGRDGRPLPCLSLQRRIPPKLLESYQRLLREIQWIPCQSSVRAVPALLRNNWLDRIYIERLEAQVRDVQALLLQAEQHWEEAFYRRLAWSFGLTVNSEPFLALACGLPLRILARRRSDLLQIEALVFGQAGFLEGSFQDAYPAALAREYRFLRQKYQLEPLSEAQWKFLRLRPANFPTVRLAQFAALLHHATQWFAAVLDEPDIRRLEQLFSVPVSAYWHTHYRFDRPSVARAKLPGRDLLHAVFINTVAPMLFLYGRQKQLPALQDRAVRLLESLPPETNAILHEWETLGVPAAHAAHGQALLHLKRHYCDKRRCLECAIGNAVLRAEDS